MARKLSLCAGAYITSNNALHAPKSGLATFGIASLGFVLLLIFDWRCKSTFAKVFFAKPCKAAFSPNFFTAKVFYHTVVQRKLIV